jgi:DNA-binding transcriptional LysR family regulator
MTQPTLSRQLKLLEEELGVKLFQRGRHNIHLTEKGMLFRRRVQEIVNMADRAKSELSQWGEELIGEIIIGCNESQSMNELSELMMDFREFHPLVKFTLRSGNNVEIREWLEQGIIDIGLLVEPVEIEKLTYLRLKYKDQWGIIIHKDLDLACKTVIHSEDLLGKPLITITDVTIHSELANWSGKNAEMMMPIVHYNLLTNAIPLARIKAGVVICPRPVSTYEDLKFIPFEPALKLGARLAWVDNQVFSKASGTFIQYLKNYKTEM